MASLIPLAKPKDFPLELQLEWYKIRDLFFGMNSMQQDIMLALQLAKACKYPDAEYLVKMCENAQTPKEVKKVFKHSGWNDARALCFSFQFRIGTLQNMSSNLERSSNLGYAWAQSILSWYSSTCNPFEFASLSARQGERDGFYILGSLFQSGKKCIASTSKAKNNWLIASNLGCVYAMASLADILPESSAQAWSFRSRAAKLGYTFQFSARFDQIVKNNPQNDVLFIIGQTLHGNIHEHERLIFKRTAYLHVITGSAKKAVAFYLHQIESYRNAVLEWIKVGRKLKVCRDIRKVIGMLIWNTRGEALY